MTPRAAGSNSSVQPVAASRASVAESTISSSRPASSATRARNASPFSAARQASVAMSRARMTPRARILSRQTSKRLDRARNRRLADAPRSGNAFAETNDAGERVDDAKPVGGRAGDQQPAIVGAEIERRIGRCRWLTSGARQSSRNGRSRRMPYGVRRPQRDRRRGAHGVEAAAAAGPRRSSKPFLPRRNSAARRRGCVQLNRANCTSRRPARAILCFPAYEPCPAPACRALQLHYVTATRCFRGIEPAMNLQQPPSDRADNWRRTEFWQIREICRRAVRAAQRGSDAAARPRPLYRRRQPPRPGLCGHGAQPQRPRHHSRHRRPKPRGRCPACSASIPPPI